MMTAAIALASCTSAPSNEIPSTCPPNQPNPASACSGTLVCAYELGCERVVAHCEEKRWVVERQSDLGDACSP